MVRILSLMLLVLISFASCKEKETEKIETKEKEPPNIVLIVADDLGYADMSIAKLATDVNTPNIDKIAKSGVRFTDAYDSSPICNQSRTAIITGSYPQRLGSYWYSSEGLHDSQFVTIAELLKKKDYKTGYIGKTHYGKHDSDSTHRSFPNNHGFDYFFGHTSARKHYFHHKQEIEDSFLKAQSDYKRVGQSLRQGPLWENKNKVDTLGFLTEMIGKKSIEFIAENKDQPFFLQVAFNAAHNFTHQLPENYLKEKNLKGYHDWNPEKEDYYEWYKQGRFPNNKEGREHFLGQVKFMDETIGKIVTQLEDLNLKKNTLLIFISDNGGSTPIYANNYPLRGSKYVLYEGGIRVQMLASFPEKYKAGEVSDNMVSAMDIFPTICEEVGIAIPSHIDGISLKPLLRGEDSDLQHEVLVWDTGHEMAVRKGNWKLRKAVKDDHAQYEMVDLELGTFLYDLNEDIGEKSNLISENDSISRMLNELHTNWKATIMKTNHDIQSE